jgi:hypothetical protein
MSIDRTGDPGDDDETPPITRDRGDRSAEQTPDQQADTNDYRSHERAETRTREEYADAMRDGGPPSRTDSSEAIQSPNGSGLQDRAGTEGTGRDTRGPYDRDGDSDNAVMPEDASDRAEPPMAETRTREEYADAMRRNGPLDGHQDPPADPDTEPARDVPETSALVTHYHGEFKDQQLDLYTDGTRWAAADTPRRRDTVGEKGEIPDQLPGGEELVDSAGEESSRLERLRRDVYEESDDEMDVLEKDANVVHDVFSHPPTGSYEGTPTQPHIYATPHSGIDAGSMATALFTLGLVIDRTVHWAVGYYDKHAKGR